MSAVTIHADAVNRPAPWHLAILDTEGRKAAEILSTSGMIPSAYAGKPMQIQIAISMGARIGLDWVSSLNGICVINNRATVWGDAALAVCRSSPVFEDIEETNNGKDGREFSATCTVKRKGQSPTVRTFSMVDAICAGLDKKGDTWGKYPKRMCAMRARAYAMRDAFTDVLQGFPIAEELRDVEAEVVGTTIGDGVDLSQQAPPAEKRGRPPGAKTEVQATAEPAEDPGKLPEAGAPTQTDPGRQTLVEHVAAEQAAAEKTPEKTELHSREKTKELLATVFADLATRPAVIAANERMGKKLSACADGEEVHRFYLALSEELAKIKVAKP